MSYDIVPESAPFSPEQRAWLNGFFAGILGSLDAENARSGNAVTLAAAAALLPPLSGQPAPPAESEENFPWHDSTLSAPQRMALAEGKPLDRRMMAAMAQLNCGTCGYLCKTYAEAIATGKEKSLNLCTPGGTETVKLLRELNKERKVQNAVQDSQTPPISHQPVGSRDNPAVAKLISSERLNREGSSKDTRHVAINLTNTNLRYQVGDSLGVIPTNCGQLIQLVCDAGKLSPGAIVQHGGSSKPLVEVLRDSCLRSLTTELCERAALRIRERPKHNGSVSIDSQLLQRLAAFVDSDEFGEMDVCDFLHEFSPSSLTEQDLADTLLPMRPRLYSIASSQQAYPEEVHLTVGRVEDEIRGRPRKGVASTMFADRLQSGADVRVFIQPSHGFTIPSNPGDPIIMVGPGTGIAPFMGFLQQREFERTKFESCGENWLFFGDQKSEFDFLYKRQLNNWLDSGLLSRLDLAFSRDSEEKVYVQHRMLQHGAEIYRWLQLGSYFYVCGDAKRMARDVEAALIEILIVHGDHTSSSAKDFVKSMKQSKRYAADVY
jgi:sulfite reductase (NADPH) flavoprotein alpha-component